MKGTRHQQEGLLREPVAGSQSGATPRQTLKVTSQQRIPCEETFYSFWAKDFQRAMWTLHTQCTGLKMHKQHGTYIWVGVHITGSPCSQEHSVLSHQLSLEDLIFGNVNRTNVNRKVSSLIFESCWQAPQSLLCVYAKSWWVYSTWINGYNAWYILFDWKHVLFLH